jgi:glycosyltransferase involved in cell wall biosynthesis
MANTKEQNKQKKKEKNKQNKQKEKENKSSIFPMVSICSPTFNRRPFIPYMIKCFEHQTYPKDRLEWIIVDDGTDKIEDLVSHIPQVKYFKYNDKLTLGKKRNISHEKSSGDIIIYMDDDDYYPPERISHAVETLQKNPQALCAGSSEMFIYFKHINKMYKFGPYGPNHATAATFAFRRELLQQTNYDETACLAEEKYFLKNYTIPFVQLDSMKSILVFSHNHNSFDKKQLLNQGTNKFVNETILTPDMFIKEPNILQFFMKDIDELLNNYQPGKPENKPDVLKQIEDITRNREKMIQEQKIKEMEYKKMYQSSFINNNNGIDDIIKTYRKQIDDMTILIQELMLENTYLKDKLKYLEDKMKEKIL